MKKLLVVLCFCSIFACQYISYDTLLNAIQNQQGSPCNNGGTTTEPVVSSDSLKAYYPLNGDAIDASKNGNDGVVKGPVATIDHNGTTNNAMWFNGSSDVIKIKDSPSLRPQVITLSAWIKLSSMGYDRKVVGKINFDYGGTNDADSYNLGIFYDDKLELWIWDKGWVGLRHIAGGTVLQSGVWYFVAATFDGTWIRTYVNGQLDRECNVGKRTISYSDQDVIIGYTPTAEHFSGSIDEVRLFSRPLDVNEINSIMTIR